MNNGGKNHTRETTQLRKLEINAIGKTDKQMVVLARQQTLE
jgi:hypothetical protein